MALRPRRSLLLMTGAAALAALSACVPEHERPQSGALSAPASAAASPAPPAARAAALPAGLRPLAARDVDPRPERILGLDDAALTRLLGQPAVTRRERPAEVWQYRSARCVLDVVLYPEEGQARVAYLEARERQAGADLPVQPCLADFLRRGPAF